MAACSVGLAGCMSQAPISSDPSNPRASSQPTTAGPSSVPLTQSGPVPVPLTGAYLGTHFSAALPDRRGAIDGLESDIGRPFAIDHVYYDWQSPFPGDY